MQAVALHGLCWGPWLPHPAGLPWQPWPAVVAADGLLAAAGPQQFSATSNTLVGLVLVVVVGLAAAAALGKLPWQSVRYVELAAQEKLREAGDAMPSG